MPLLIGGDFSFGEFDDLAPVGEAAADPGAWLAAAGRAFRCPASAVCDAHPHGPPDERDVDELL